MKDVIVQAKTVAKIMDEFELDDNQFANLLGVSFRTVAFWRENGIVGRRGNTLALFDCLMMMRYLSKKDPEGFMSLKQLKDLIKKAENPAALCVDFIPYVNELGPAISVLKHQRLISVMAAIMLGMYLQKQGKKVIFNALDKIPDLKDVFNDLKK